MFGMIGKRTLLAGALATGAVGMSLKAGEVTPAVAAAAFIAAMIVGRAIASTFLAIISGRIGIMGAVVIGGGLILLAAQYGS